METVIANIAGALPGTSGYIYPNEFELHWGLLVVIYPYLTGLVAGAFILASLERVFKVHEITPVYRLSLISALAFLVIAPVVVLYILVKLSPPWMDKPELDVVANEVK